MRAGQHLIAPGKSTVWPKEQTKCERGYCNFKKKRKKKELGLAEKMRAQDPGNAHQDVSGTHQEVQNDKKRDGKQSDLLSRLSVCCVVVLVLLLPLSFSGLSDFLPLGDIQT